jgi:hypothetical protein
MLEEHVASASATLDFTSWRNDALYDEYEIHLIDVVPATNVMDIWLRVSTDGGATYAATNYAASLHYAYSGGTGMSGASSTVAFQISDSVNSSASGGGWQGRVYFANPGAASYKRFLAQGQMFHGTLSAMVFTEVMGAWNTTTAINALRIMCSSGNITSGIVRIYGIPKTRNGGSALTLLNDTFNRADGAVGNAVSPVAPWFVSSGTWDINSNRLRETGGGSERFILQQVGYRQGTRTIQWTMNTKPTSGDGGLFWRSTYNVAAGLLINVEATYKLYARAAGSYSAATVASGTPVAPANGDVITVVDTGNRVTISVNGGAPVVYDDVMLTSEGPCIGFRNSSGGGMTHDSIVVTEA